MASRRGGGEKGIVEEGGTKKDGGGAEKGGREVVEGCMERGDKGMEKELATLPGR